MRRWIVGFVLLVVACGPTAPGKPTPDLPADPTGSAPVTTPPTTEPEPDPTWGTTGTDGDPDLLEVQFLGVGGYVLRHGDDAVMTPPMYTNPDFFATTLGTIASDPVLVDRFSEGVRFDDVSAMLVGHGHYDHLLDAATVWPKTRQAVIYGNATVAHLLAAHAPDPPDDCEDRPEPTIVIPSENVVQLDDPEGTLGVDLVDRRMCGGTDAGEWIAVPGADVRFRALCSMHPDQVGPIHFAPGSVTEDQCVPPAHADDWLEGDTVAFLVDFLDDAGDPVFRVYYQDAPTEPPIGLFDPSLLAEKPVDVALLNVGNYTAVADAPGATLALMAPRYTIGGHWEDFFVTQAFAPQPILGHDIDDYRSRAAAAMGDKSERQALVDGAWSTERSWVPDPGTAFVFTTAE